METEYADQQSGLYKHFEDLMAEPSLQSFSSKVNTMLQSTEGLVELTEVVAHQPEEEETKPSATMTTAGDNRKSKESTDREIDNLMPPTDAPANVETKKKRSIFSMLIGAYK